MNFELTEEQQMVRDTARRFAETEIKPVAAKLDATHEHPAEICRKLAELGFLGIAVPEEYGGGGMDYVSYVLALIEISKACASTGVIMSVNNSLYCFPVMAFGTHEQKMKYLKPVASGEYLGCFGLTEAGAGSDPAGMRTTAVLEGDDWVINGRKEVHHQRQRFPVCAWWRRLPKKEKAIKESVPLWWTWKTRRAILWDGWKKKWGSTPPGRRNWSLTMPGSLKMPYWAIPGKGLNRC